MSQADSTYTGASEWMSSPGHGAWCCSHWPINLSPRSAPHSYSSSCLHLAGWPWRRKLLYLAGKMSETLWVPWAKPGRPLGASWVCSIWGSDVWEAVDQLLCSIMKISCLLGKEVGESGKWALTPSPWPGYKHMVFQVTAVGVQLREGETEVCLSLQHPKKKSFRCLTPLGIYFFF